MGFMGLWYGKKIRKYLCELISTKLQAFCIEVECPASKVVQILRFWLKKGSNRSDFEPIRSGVKKSADTLLLSSGRSEIKNLLKWLLSSSDICVKCYGL